MLLCKLILTSILSQVLVIYPKKQKYEGLIRLLLALLQINQFLESFYLLRSLLAYNFDKFKICLQVLNKTIQSFGRLGPHMNRPELAH